MRKAIKWIENHLFISWGIISVVFALVVHILFHIDAEGTFWEAKWSAGDILTYTSTISLGLLAVWQNRKFKQENDIAQSRLEALNEQANSLSMISTIAGIEHENLSRLRSALDSFSTACDPIEISAKLADSLKGEDQKLSAMAAMGAQEKIIDDCYFRLARELRVDPKIYSELPDSSDSFIRVMYDYYFAAKIVVRDLRDNPHSHNKEKAEALSKAKIDFVGNRELLLIRKENMLNKVIYGNLSLDEIQKMYRKENRELH